MHSVVKIHIGFGSTQEPLKIASYRRMPAGQNASSGTKCHLLGYKLLNFSILRPFLKTNPLIFDRFYSSIY